MKITKRERDILKLLTLENEQIAYKLCISHHTVKAYVHSLHEKFEAKTRTEVLIKALRMGVITPFECKLSEVDEWVK